MLGLDQVTDDYYSQFLTSTVWLHSCQVSQNDQDSPGILAPVPVDTKTH